MTASVTKSALAAAVIGLTGAIVHAQDARRLASPPALTWETCEDLHKEYATRFVGAPGSGLSRMMTGSMLDRSGVLDLGPAKYAIDSIELVGLLRNSSPVVYAAPYHDLPVESARAKTREINDFERTAIASFRDGADMAMSPASDAGALRCMGTLRAGDACVRCHKNNKRNDLMGALSYTLRPLPKS